MTSAFGPALAEPLGQRLHPQADGAVQAYLQQGAVAARKTGQGRTHVGVARSGRRHRGGRKRSVDLDLQTILDDFADGAPLGRPHAHRRVRDELVAHLQERRGRIREGDQLVVPADRALALDGHGVDLQVGDRIVGPHAEVVARRQQPHELPARGVELQVIVIGAAAFAARADAGVVRRHRGAGNIGWRGKGLVHAGPFRDEIDRTDAAAHIAALVAPGFVGQAVDAALRGQEMTASKMFVPGWSRLRKYWICGCCTIRL